jgi:nitrite reductase/ring-hydroxylating ferredoxin subunit
VAAVGDVLPAGMINIQADGIEMVLCNYEGKYYALERRCGHMNAPLELGTLNGYIVTCPMHSAQFSVQSGEVINPALLRERAQPKLDGPMAVPGYLGKLIEKVKTMDIRVFPVSIEGEDIFVETGVPPSST